MQNIYRCCLFTQESFYFFNVVDLKEMTNNDDNEVTDEMKRKDPAVRVKRGVKTVGKAAVTAYKKLSRKK